MSIWKIGLGSDFANGGGFKMYHLGLMPRKYKCLIKRHVGNTRKEKHNANSVGLWKIVVDTHSTSVITSKLGIEKRKTSANLISVLDSVKYIARKYPTPNIRLKNRFIYQGTLSHIPSQWWDELMNG